VVFAWLPNLNWAGFYLMKGDELVLGPFQGRPACVRIAVGRGVCGTAVSTRTTQVVPDVQAFPGHIACDVRSRSEIVVPVLVGGEVVAVLDLDSAELDNFGAEDRAGLEALIADLAPHVDWQLATAG
jgi:GAF domain-containing protein